MSTYHLVVGISVLFASATAWAQTAAPAAAGLRNPFFAMDTGLRDGQSRTTEAQLDLVKELGYAGISWTQGDPKKTREAADAAKERGLKLFTVYCGATLTKEKLDYGPAKQTIDALKGTDTMIWLYITSKELPKSSADGDDIAVAGLRDLADHAQAAGLKIALYPHAGFWVERVQDAVRVVKKAQRANLGVTFNLCHCLSVGDELKIGALLEDAAPHLLVVTISGADADSATKGWGKLIQTLDQGTFDVSTVLRKLRELRYAGPIGLQHYGIKGDSKENLARSMAGWKTVSAKAAR